MGKRVTLRARYAQGFTLLELMLSTAILVIVIGVIVQGVMTMQARNSVETSKLDMMQESRQFMDQIVNDLHQSGFPRIGMFLPASLASPSNCLADTTVACGLITISQSAVQFEGDVDGTGVSEVYIQLSPANGPCPCTIQRGTVPKSVGGIPPYYTEVNNVMNTNVFVAYDNNGAVVPLPIAANAFQTSYNINAVGITLYVKSSQADPKTGLFPTVTMTSTAKLND
jgi:prepilin-type N-terminal cleavage/methylation domain-containing protein